MHSAPGHSHAAFHSGPRLPQKSPDGPSLPARLLYTAPIDRHEKAAAEFRKKKVKTIIIAESPQHPLLQRAPFGIYAVSGCRSGSFYPIPATLAGGGVPVDRLRGQAEERRKRDIIRSVPFSGRHKQTGIRPGCEYPTTRRDVSTQISLPRRCAFRRMALPCPSGLNSVILHSKTVFLRSQIPQTGSDTARSSGPALRGAPRGCRFPRSSRDP